jgi:hypothetical protein
MFDDDMARARLKMFLRGMHNAEISIGDSVACYRWGMNGDWGYINLRSGEVTRYDSDTRRHVEIPEDPTAVEAMDNWRGQFHTRPRVMRQGED